MSDGKISEPALSPALVTDNFPVKAAYERGWSRGFGAAAITGGLQVTAWSALVWWPTIWSLSNTDGEWGALNLIGGMMIGTVAVGLTTIGVSATGYGIYKASNNPHQVFADQRLREAQRVGFIRGMGLGLAIQGGFNVLATSLLIPAGDGEPFGPELHTLFLVMLGVGAARSSRGRSWPWP